MNNIETNINAVTHEHVPVIYRVHLIMPASHDGFVDIVATSEDEASVLALDSRFGDVEWVYDLGDQGTVEVCDVECVNPAGNGAFIEHGYSVDDPTWVRFRRC